MRGVQQVYNRRRRGERQTETDTEKVRDRETGTEREKERERETERRWSGVNGPAELTQKAAGGAWGRPTSLGCLRN